MRNRSVKWIAFSLLVVLFLEACLLYASDNNQTAPTPGAGVVSPTATLQNAAQPAAGSTAPTPTDGPLAPPAKDAYAVVEPGGQKIVYWHTQSGKNQAALEKIVNQFNSSNPWKIQVEAVSQGAEADLAKKVQSVQGAETLPDLLDASQTNAAIYQRGGKLSDMNSLVTSARWGLKAREYADIPAGILAQDVYTVFVDARLGFPFYRSLGVLYANQDWLKELGVSQIPENPQDFKAAACKAAKQPFSRQVGSSGAATGLVLPQDGRTLISWVLAFEGDVFGSANNFYTLGTDSAVSAASFLQDLVKEGCATFSDDPQSIRAQFGAGRALFSAASTDDLALYSSSIEQGAKFTWTLGPLPHTSPDPIVMAWGPSVSIVKKASEKQLAAWLFLKYLLSPTVQSEWAVASGFLPVRSSSGKSLAGSGAQPPAYLTAIGMLENIKPESPVPGFELVLQKAAQAVAEITSPPYPDARERMIKLNQEANQVMQDEINKK